MTASAGARPHICQAPSSCPHSACVLLQPCVLCCVHCPCPLLLQGYFDTCSPCIFAFNTFSRLPPAYESFRPVCPLLGVRFLKSADIRTVDCFLIERLPSVRFDFDKERCCSCLHSFPHLLYDYPKDVCIGDPHLGSFRSFTNPFPYFSDLRLTVKLAATARYLCAVWSFCYRLALRWWGL